jgi:ribosome-associated protein
MTKSLLIALQAIDDKKGVDLVVLDVSKVASFANFFVLCTGESSRQVQAIADEVEFRLKKQNLRANHIEGYRNAEWVLLDYIDVVVHVFSKKARAYYDLERLWRDGKRLDVEELLKPEAAKPAVRKATSRRSKRTASPE